MPMPYLSGRHLMPKSQALQILGHALRLLYAMEGRAKSPQKKSLNIEGMHWKCALFYSAWAWNSGASRPWLESLSCSVNNSAEINFIYINSFFFPNFDCFCVWNTGKFLVLVLFWIRKKQSQNIRELLYVRDFIFSHFSSASENFFPTWENVPSHW